MVQPLAMYSDTLAAASSGVPGGRAALNHIVGHEFRGCHYLFVRGGPGEHLVNVIEKLIRHPASSHDVRLLTQILGQQQTGTVQSDLAIFVDRTNDQLRPVDVV